MKNFENYLIMIGIRSVDFTYKDEVLLNHKDYFKKCMNNGLSAYKALLFLHDYINNNYTLDDI